MISISETYLRQTYDCLILVHPHIQVLEKIAKEIQKLDHATLNISKSLSAYLILKPANEHSRLSQNWLLDSLTSFKKGPVLCTCPDLLFDPSLEIDPLALFRQVARLIQIIVLWPGDYSGKTLSYAVPEHHHFRTWKVSDSLLQQPVVRIQRISS